MEKIELLAALFNAVKQVEERFMLYLKQEADSSLQFNAAQDHLLTAIKIAIKLGDKQTNGYLESIFTATVKGDDRFITTMTNSTIDRIAKLICEELTK